MADPVIDGSERLQDAIDRLSTRRLARLCQNLCAKNPSARTFFEAHLFVEEDKVPGPKLPEPENLRPFGHKPGPEDENDDDDEESYEDDGNDGDDKENEKSVASEPARKPKSLKRIRPRFAVCTNCKEEFDVAENTQESCNYHSGMTLNIPWKASAMMLILNYRQILSGSRFLCRSRRRLSRNHRYGRNAGRVPRWLYLRML
jgi:hypothetical protein